MLGRALDSFNDILRGDMRRLTEAYGSRLADHFADVEAAMPRTLIHGDYRTTNLFLGESGSNAVALIDWKMASMQCGLYDVTYSSPAASPGGAT